MVACWALLSTSYSIVNAQQVDPSTGNLVYSTVNPPPQNPDPHSWSGFIVNSTNGGGFSGGNVPAYNPNTGTFIFGYTQRTVAYTTGLNLALANAGTGIQVTGLKYSWEYFNQDMSRGTLTGNISLTSSTGQTLHSYNYNMPQTTNGWTRMTGTENFNTQYSPSSLGNLNVSFTGKDDRFWAGYYGPQIRDIGVNLLYSVPAPPPIPTDFPRWLKLTDENGSFTLTKPGVVRYGAEGSYIYQSLQPGTYDCSNGAWGNDPIGGVYKSCSLGTNSSTPSLPNVPSLTPTNNTTLTSPTTVTVEPVTTVTTVESTPSVGSTPTTSTVVETVNTMTTTTSNPSQVSSSNPTVASPSVSTSTTSSSSSGTTGSSTTVTTTTQSSSKGSGGGSVSLAMSVITKNSERDSSNLSIAQTATEQAKQDSAKVTNEAQSVAAAQQAQTITQAQAVIASVTTNQAQATNNNQANNNQSIGSGLSIAPTSTSVVSIGGLRGPDLYSLATTASSSNSSMVNEQSTSSFSSLINFSNRNDQESSKFNSQETNSNNETRPLFDQTNPLNSSINASPIIPKMDIPTPSSVVNRNARDNDAAGNVTIASIARQPQGFEAYSNMLRDNRFYEPKEIYRNQNVVDNARAQRLLSGASDRLHQRMVDQQYNNNKGN